MIVAWIVAGVYTLLVFGAAYFARRGGILERDKRNPYNFYCKKCGQMYITIGELGTSRRDYLEHNGTIYDEDCKCHKITEPRREKFRLRY